MTRANAGDLMHANNELIGARNRANASGAVNPYVIVAAIMLLGTLVLAIFEAPGIPCLFREVAQLPCPGCGLTRSLKAMWSGDFMIAFRYHPLGSPLFAACVLALSFASARRLLGERIPAFSISRRGWLAVLAALLGVWIVKLSDLLMGGGFFLH